MQTSRQAFTCPLQIGNNLTVSVWDIGGQSKLRQLWKHYYLGTGSFPHRSLLSVVAVVFTFLVCFLGTVFRGGVLLLPLGTA